MVNVPKGTKDMLPRESHKWQAVEAAAKKITALYNVKQIRTPVFEHAELFLRSIGDSTDIVNKEMYIFEDKGGRKMALRPEGTAGVVRSVLENNLCETLPQKVFYIEGVYRYEQPQAGRYREHHQFGAEFFGSELPCFEVELLSMARDFLKEIGFNDLRLRINTIGCNECRAEYNKALRAFLAGVNDKICGDCKRRAEINPLRTLDCKVPSCKEIYKSAPQISDFLCDNCKQHHKQVLKGLDAAGIQYFEDKNLVRGHAHGIRVLRRRLGCAGRRALRQFVRTARRQAYALRGVRLRYRTAYRRGGNSRHRVRRQYALCVCGGAVRQRARNLRRYCRAIAQHRRFRGIRLDG